MKFLSNLLTVGALASTAFALDKPKVPLSTTGRWIIGEDGQRVKLRCVNWAGHMEANVPEGLHRQPVSNIADWIANNGFNCVRLTFSIDMALNTGMKVQDSFRNGARNAGVDEAAVMRMYDEATQKNPFIKDATVLDVFGAVQDALWERGVMVVLDNHVSKAKWCCNLDDGNGWWSDAPIYFPPNSQYFDSKNWLDGLGVMAQWSKGRPGVVGIGLRNELRAHVTQIPWGGKWWFKKMPEAARKVHGINPDLLIMNGGLDGGTNLGALRNGKMPVQDWPNKNVWEAHSYSFTVTTPDFGSCDVEKTQYGFWFGFVLEQGKETTGPLFLGEFGAGQVGGPNKGLTDDDFRYIECLVGYMENNDADWGMWALQGTYYIREGIVDFQDSFGILDSSWTDWKNKEFPAMLGKMWNMTQTIGN